MPQFVLFLRGIVLPTITLMAMGTSVWVVLHQIPVPEWFVAIVSSITASWVMARASYRGRRRGITEEPDDLGDGDHDTRP